MIVIVIQITSIVIRPSRPVVHTIPAASEAAILTAHSLIGQITVFAAARTVALEELGWSDFSGERLTPLIATTTASVLRTLRLEAPGEAQ